MKTNKYKYLKVIQQNYGQGWEDVSEYETDSEGNHKEFSGKVRQLGNGMFKAIPLITLDLKEYKLLGYPTRVIRRKELIDIINKIV